MSHLDKYTLKVYTRGVSTDILISRIAEKQLRKVPRSIRAAFQDWYNSILFNGIEKVREVKGYRDKKLSGERKGQRSVRLNRAYRIFYTEKKGEITVLTVLEVNKHDY